MRARQHRHSLFIVCLIVIIGCAAMRARAYGSEGEGLAAHEDNMVWTLGGCGDWEYFDFAKQTCRHLARLGERSWNAVAYANAFAVGDLQSGPRGVNKLASPNMVMTDVGRSFGGHHYWNLQLMLTAERWTFPEEGIPEFLQVGEKNESGVPFVDAHHPHSSPLMGLTVSDTISLGATRNFLTLAFSPRGASTDGPVAYMHRPTGAVNPNTPLGHHLGQDEGHISSTVLSANLGWAGERFEISGFNGDEPSPMAVDMPMGAMNSMSVRWTHPFSPRLYAMASYAYVKDAAATPSNTRDAVRRSSASFYVDSLEWQGWTFRNALIFGLTTEQDRTAQLSSYGEEFVLSKSLVDVFGRVEVLQRTAEQLQIKAPVDPHWPYYVGALSLGADHRFWSRNAWEARVGLIATADILPEVWQAAYGGNPWTGQAFVRLSGMQMH